MKDICGTTCYYTCISVLENLQMFPGCTARNGYPHWYCIFHNRLAATSPCHFSCPQVIVSHAEIFGITLALNHVSRQISREESLWPYPLCYRRAISVFQADNINTKPY